MICWTEAMEMTIFMEEKGTTRYWVGPGTMRSTGETGMIASTAATAWTVSVGATAWIWSMAGRGMIVWRTSQGAIPCIEIKAMTSFSAPMNRLIREIAR